MHENFCLPAYRIFRKPGFSGKAEFYDVPKFSMTYLSLPLLKRDVFRKSKRPAAFIQGFNMLFLFPRIRSHIPPNFPAFGSKYLTV